MPGFVADALTRPINQRFILELKTAKSWGNEPLDILGVHVKRQLNKKERKRINRLLKLAYQILEDEICQSCGVPDWLARTADNRVQFKAMKHRCESCSVKDQAQKKYGNSLGPGESIYVKPEFYGEDDETTDVPISRRDAMQNMTTPDPLN